MTPERIRERLAGERVDAETYVAALRYVRGEREADDDGSRRPL